MEERGWRKTTFEQHFYTFLFTFVCRYCLESVCSPLESLNPPGREKTCSLFWHNWLRYSKVIMVDIQARSLGKICQTTKIRLIIAPSFPSVPQLYVLLEGPPGT